MHTLAALFSGMALPAPFFLLFTKSQKGILRWIGWGVIFALLSIAARLAEGAG